MTEMFIKIQITAAMIAGFAGCANQIPTAAVPKTDEPIPIDPSAEAATRPGDLLVVLNKAEATVSLVDPLGEQVVATIPVGVGPHEVAVSADHTLAVVGNYGTREAPGSTLSVIDLNKRLVVRTVELTHRRPHGMQFLTDSSQVLVTVEDSKAVVCVDVLTGDITCEIGTEQEVSHMLVVAPDATRAYVANIRSGTVSVLDLKSNELVTNVPTGKGAEGIDITPDGRELWVTNRGEDTISIIDTQTLKVVATLASAAFPIRARITPDGAYALISNAKSGLVRVFDVKTKQEVRAIDLNAGKGETEGRLFGDRFGDSSVPIGIVITPDGKRAFVAHANADVISVLDLTSWRPVGKLRAGKEPDGMAWVPAK